jgi:hypothetical protein
MMIRLEILAAAERGLVTEMTGVVCQVQPAFLSACLSQFSNGSRMTLPTASSTSDGLVYPESGFHYSRIGGAWSNVNAFRGAALPVRDSHGTRGGRGA